MAGGYRPELDQEYPSQDQADGDIVGGCPKKRGTSGNVGLSENSVPLNPMVNDHYPY